MTAVEQRTWLNEHAARLRKRIDELATAPAKAASKRKEEATEADKLERRVARLLRSASQLDAAVERERQRANRLLKSKKPRERAEALISAIDELPLDLAIAVADEVSRRATARKGDAE